MKTFKCTTIFLISVLMTMSCRKEETGIYSKLVGKWINTINYNLEIEFIDSTLAKLGYTNYRYKIYFDSIGFQYAGPLLIYVKPQKFRYTLDDDQDLLMIKDLNKLFPLSLDSGWLYFSKHIIPDKFIGMWISIDITDTIVFRTNKIFESYRFPVNHWYDYTYSADSMRITYSGPDKILEKPLTVKYEVVNDTLVLNFSKNYYPDISTGLHKYTKINTAYYGPNLQK